jgi:hypothetical protein
MPDDDEGDEAEVGDLRLFVSMFIHFLKKSKREITLDSLAEKNKEMMEKVKLADEDLYDEIVDAFAERRAFIKSQPKN